jgi:hypothetical protein
MTYLDELSQRLAEVGIRGRLRSRIVAEFADHLACDPKAKLGAPKAVARRFADELGTERARRAARVAFGALAVAGTLFAGAFLASQAEGLPVSRWGQSASPLGALGLVLIAIGSQVAFVAGLLALLRMFRRRRDPILVRGEAVLLARRAMVGLAAGFACLVGLALVGAEFAHHMPPWWQPVAFAAALLGACFLAAATPAVVAGMRVRPVRPCPVGDLSEDLGPLVPPKLRGRSWLLALLVAVSVGAVIALAGVIQDDPYDGLLRGIADGTACLIGFALLGSYLGLRQIANS